MDSGSYVILLHLAKEEVIEVGRLGSFSFPPGYYAYVGSALSGLKARLMRHLRVKKPKKWHIDYLREKAEVIGYFEIYSEKKLECSINSIVAEISESQPVKKFGSTDCSCYSHLSYFSQDPWDKIEAHLRRFCRESNLTFRFERFMQ